MAKYNYEDIVIKINRLMLSHSLNLNDLISVLEVHRKSKPSSSQKSKYKKINSVASEVLNNKKVPQDIDSFKDFSKEINSAFDVNLPLKVFDSKLKIFTRFFSFIISIIVFLFVLYIVFGGIFENESNFIFFGSPIFTIFILALLIVLLASLEGTQISVTLLRMKDLNSVKHDYPRAFKIHSKLKSVEMTSKYLAGRQLLVVIIVFVSAQITSFSNMKVLPFTNSSFPQIFSPWFQIIFLKLGVLGAFLVLWIGQLLPQFLANRHPHRFLNIPFVNLIIELTWIVEKLGFIKPWEWLSKKWSESNTIPISPKELYIQKLDQRGIGTLGIKKEWKLSKSNSILKYQNSIFLKKNGFNSVIDESLEIKDGLEYASSDYFLIRDGEEIEGALNIHNPEIYEMENGWRRIQNLIESKTGSYQPEDVIIRKNRTVFKTSENSITSDGIRVNLNMKFLMFKITFEDIPKKLGNGSVEIYSYDDQSEESILTSKLELYQKNDDQNQPYFEYVESYPSKNSYYCFSWQVVF